MFFVDIEGERDAAFCVGPVGQPVGRACHHLVHECLGVFGRGCGIAVFAQQIECVNCRCGGVEADPICESSVFVWVVSEDQGDFAVFGWRAAQACPFCRQVGHKIDPISVPLVGRNRAFGGVVKECLAFERDCTR